MAASDESMYRAWVQASLMVTMVYLLQVIDVGY
jgi:hypothetical protein